MAPRTRIIVVLVAAFLLILAGTLGYWRSQRSSAGVEKPKEVASATPAPNTPQPGAPDAKEPSAVTAQSATPAPAPRARPARPGLVPANISAAQGQRRPPEFSRQTPKAEASEAQREGLAALQSRLPQVDVQFDPLTGAPSHIMAPGRFLTAPVGAGGDGVAAVRQFVDANTALFGHNATALDASRVTRDDVTAHNGMRTVVWQQEVDGIPVYKTILKANLTKDGAIVSMGDHFLADATGATQMNAADRATLAATPPVDVRKAVSLAAADLGDQLAPGQVANTSAPSGAEQKQLLASPLLSDTAAQLAWLPLTADEMRLTWDVTLMSLKLSEMYRVLVDVKTGEVLLRTSLTNDISDATYRVHANATTKKPFDSPAPMLPGTSTPSGAQAPEVPRNLVTLQALSTTASPNGWINDGGTQTLGNNVDAHTDLNADNQADLPRPTSASRIFDFPMDLTQDPSTYRDAAVTHLFYITNWMHDQLYSLGFTESAGNFQTNNFGKGGQGNDALQADAQDGSGTNNANMSTPSDGFAPRMQMYIFPDPNPSRDGDLDNVIVLHEYTHGLSNRLVGGGVGLFSLASRGQGEGWSDFYGLALLADPNSDPTAVYPGGSYATYQIFFPSMTSNYYYGIRRYPYSTDMTKNPLTFKDIDPTKASPHNGIPLSPLFGSSNSNPSEVHNVGEVWCMMLWECRAQLIAKLGAAGNQTLLQLVTDAMKLSPANPNFVQSRDAIIQADLVSSGGANRNELWAAFAKRGLGASAFAPASSTTTGVVEAFDIPDSLSVSPITPFTSTGTRLSGPFTPSSTNYTLSNLGATPLNWTAAKTQSWLNLSATSGTLAGSANTTVTVSINASALNLPAGTYSDTVTFTNVSNGAISTRSVSLTVNPYQTRAITIPLDFDPNWAREGEWAYGTPTGNGTPSDPTAGATGTKVFGINLNGNYSTALGGFAYLTTGPLNLSGMTSNQLRFRRWLNTDFQPWVYATVDVSNDGVTWTNIWNNGATTGITEFAWSTVSYPLGTVADNQSTVYIRWGHRVGAVGAVVRSGWNIDDVEILTNSTTPTLTANALAVSTPFGVPVATTLTATDTVTPAGPFTFAVVSPPTNGSLSGTGANLTYTPNAGFYGVDTFSFTASNGTLTSAPASVAITVQSGAGEIAVSLAEGSELFDGASTVAYGNVLTGASAVRRFAIKNVGAGPLTLSGTSINGVHASEFSAGTFSATTLQVGETSYLDVTLSPLIVNAKTAALHILNTDPDEASFDIALTGNGTFTSGSVQLTRDINRTPSGPSIASSVVVGSQVFYLATTPNEGTELWRTDGTAAGTYLVKDIAPGITSSNISGMTNLNGTLFFAADNQVNGVELWKSDGTTVGTVLVKDINSGSAASNPISLTAVGTTLFFAATDTTNGTELWKSDGTTAGTARVKDIYGGANSSSPANLCNVNGTLYFSADNGVLGNELWKSNGTDAGTANVKNIGAGNASSVLGSFNALGSLLIFTVNDATNGTEPWVSDGTPAGTVLLKDIFTGATGSNPNSFAIMGTAMYFAATSTAEGTELWKTDGTIAGTTLVKDVLSGSGSSSPTGLTAVGSTLYFSAATTAEGRELWKSDGTTVGTVLVRDIVSGNTSSNPTSITAVGSNAFFAATGDGTADTELWITDGTPVGTKRVKDIRPGTAGSNPTLFVKLGSTLIFTATDGYRGQELWKSDGTETGTVLILDGQSGTSSASVANLRVVNGVVFFTANDEINGPELWKSDGTIAGTVLVRDIYPGTTGSAPSELITIGSTLYFAAADATGGRELWKSDGTTGGTVRVADIASGTTGSSPASLTAIGSTLYFTANNVTSGLELWKSDGTSGGTVIVKDIHTSGSSSPANLTNVNGTLFFTADNNSNGVELWKSDGTSAGTVIVKDIYSGSTGSAPGNLRALGTKLLFTANTLATGVEIWVSDGTSAGTVLLSDIVSGSGSSSPGNLTAIGATLYFTAQSTANGVELWKSDGTAGGTALLKDINPGAGSSSPSNLADINGTLYFRAFTTAEGFELWKSNGTAAGTVLVKDINAGSPDSLPLAMANVSGTAFFNATTAAAGAEIWKSDGTAAGTTLFAEVMPGTASSNPANFTASGNLLFFTASGPDLGASELFVVNFTPPAEIEVEQPALTGLVDGVSTVDFGSAEVNVGVVNKTFTIRNTGSLTLLITGITGDGPNIDSFVLPNFPVTSLPPAATTTFTVAFQPTAGGLNVATIHVANNDGDENPFDIILNGNGTVSPDITVEDPVGTERADGSGTIAIGAGAIGTPVVKTITIRNIGTGPLNLGGISVDGANSAEFIPAAPSTTTIPAKETVTLDVKFIAATTGARSAVLHIASDDADEPSYDLRLTGIGSAPAGVLHLVKDINQTGASPGIGGTARIGGAIYFAANTGLTGSELWKSDGTPEGTVLVKDISNGSGASSPANFVAVGSTLFFTASTPASGVELWKSDGTDIGTVMVKDIFSGVTPSNPSSLTNVAGTLYFAATDGNGTELWKSDGTLAGTVMVSNISSGGSSLPANFVAISSTLFFTATDGTNGTELWKSDGSVPGTVMLRDIISGGGSSSPSNLVAVGSTLFFTATDTTNGTELWKSDGTTVGTVLVRDIFSGINSSAPAQLVNAGGTLFFRAATSAAGMELWKSDGTFAGTVQVKDIYPGGNSSTPLSLLAVGTQVYFAATDGVNGIELWKSDGTTVGTVMVLDISTGASSSSPSSLFAIGSTVYFAATNAAGGLELWKTNGLANGTVLIKDINPGSNGSLPAGMIDLGGVLVFLAEDGLNGIEFWKSDGTTAGTAPIADVAPGTNGSSPANLRDLNGTLIFSASDGVNGTELWSTSGLTGPTTLIKDVAAGITGSSPGPGVVLGSSLYYAATDSVSGLELWQTDGTPAGTFRVKDIASGATSSSPTGLTRIGSTLYFAATDGTTNATELWKSDGTSVGTVMVANINPGASASSLPTNLIDFNGTLFFAANNGTSGVELWKSDGTAVGTVLVRDINSGVGSSSPSNFCVIGTKLFFTATTAANGTELWVSDGTTVGTVLVSDLIAGASGSLPTSLTAVGSTLYFAATTTASGTELWKSDGTVGGTVIVKDISSGVASSSPSNLCNVNGVLFFAATDPTNGMELWKSDGTAVGTVLVSNISTLASGSFPTGIINVNGTAYFAATSTTAGTELWKSDGTAAGTVMVADILPVLSSSPANLTVIGNLLYFTATGPDLGTELWVLETATPEIEVEQPTGTGITDGATRDCGPVALGSNTVLTFTIKNSGSGPLSGLSVSKDGTHNAEFTVGSLGATTLAPGASTTFTVTFAPAAVGTRTAAIHIASTDADENPFDVPLTGTGLTVRENWRLLHFGSAANSGDGADGNDYEKDGMSNFFEFAVNTDPKNPSSWTPTCIQNGANLEYTYTRSKAAVLEGVGFAVQWIEDLSQTNWSSVSVSESILSDNGVTQQVKATLPAGTNGRRFVRLQVTGGN